jgi:hypothetical protein
MGKLKIVQIKNLQEYTNSILLLWKRCEAPYDINHLKWLSEGNPYGRTETFALCDEDTNEIEGCGSIYPAVFSYESTKIRAGICTNFFVDKKHRLIGPALRIQKEIVLHLCRNDYDIGFVYPNENAGIIFQRVGYEFIGASKYWVKITRWDEQVMKIVNKRWLAQLCGPIIDRLMIKLQEGDYQLTHNNYRIEVANTLPNRHYTLQSESNYQNIVIPDSNSEFIRWQYGEGKSKSQHLYFILSSKSNGQIENYAIYHVNQNVLNVDYIHDLNIARVRALLKALIYYTRTNGYEGVSLNYYGSNEFMAMLKSYGFLQRKTTRNYFIYFTSRCSPMLRSIMKQETNYQFMYG